MSPREVDEATLVGEAQPVCHVTLSPEQITARTGLGFVTVEDDLDLLHRAAVEVEGLRFALQRYDRNPVPGTEIICYDPGDPTSQARTVVTELDILESVDSWWDGSRWRQGELPAHAA